MYIIKQRC